MSATTWADSTAARERMERFDRRNGGRFPAAWLLRQSDADLASLRAWLGEKLDAQLAAQRPLIYVSGPDASVRYWRMHIRANALLRQSMQVGREIRRRLGLSF